MTVRVYDYSTETGLRVRITDTDTGTTVQMSAEAFHEFLGCVKRGVFDGVAREPKIPYVHWKDGDRYPGESSRGEK